MCRRAIAGKFMLGSRTWKPRALVRSFQSKLERLMLRPPEEFRGKRITRPYEKFRTHKVVVRSIDDTLYPEVDAPAGRMSSWIVVEPYNFFHGGVEVVLSIRLVAIDDEGN